MEKINALVLGLAVLLSGLTPFLAQGQDTDMPKKEFKDIRTIGLRLGGNLSGFGEAKSDAGLQGGLYLEMQTTRQFGFTLEAIYSRQNCRINDMVLQTNYLTLPILLNFHTGVLRVQGGVFLSHLLKVKYPNYGNGIYGIGDSDYGTVLGLKLDAGRIGFGTAYYFGMQNFDPANGSSPNQRPIRSRNAQLSISIEF